MSDNVHGSDIGTNLKASLRPVDKSKPPIKKPPPQAPSSDAGGDISAPRLPPKPKREQARAIYDYKAQNDDELTIKKGDIIIILSKGVEDEGWWKGELNGKIGVFPDNYIEVIKTPPMDEVILPLRTKKPERLNEKPPPLSCIGSPGGGIGSTNPTGSQTKLNSSEVVRNNNNLKSTQQTPSSTTTVTTAITNSTTNTNSTSSDTNSSTPTSAINPLTSSLTNSTEEENFISPVVPSKKPKFRAPPGSISILPVTNLVTKSSVLGGSKPDVVPSHDTATNKLDSSCSSTSSKESKSMPDERISSIIAENEIILGSLDSTRRLNHPTANRVKGPNRRPPSMIVLTKEDDTENDSDLFDEPKSESKMHSSSITLSSLNSTLATASSPPTTTLTSAGSTNDLTEKEKGPTIPPWMKELKRNQAERRFKNNDTTTTTSNLGGEESHGVINQVTPLSPTKSNPSRSISLPVEINDNPYPVNTTTTTPSSPSTVNSLLSGKPLKAAKPSAVIAAAASAYVTTTTSSVAATTASIVSSTPSGSIPSSNQPAPSKNTSTNMSTKFDDSSILNKGVSDFSDIQVELNNLKKSMVPRRDYEDLVKKVNELTDMVETVKDSYGSVVRDLINQVAEARKNMATLEIEVDRLRKLSTTV